jgi:hypothetical protein
VRFIKLVATGRAMTAAMEKYRGKDAPALDSDPWSAWFRMESGWARDRCWVPLDEARAKLESCPDSADGRVFRAQLESQLVSAAADRVRRFDRVVLEAADLALRAELEVEAQGLAARGVIFSLVVEELLEHAGESGEVRVGRLLDLQARVRPRALAVQAYMDGGIEFPDSWYDRKDPHDEDSWGTQRAWISADHLDVLAPGAWDRICGLLEAMYEGLPADADEGRDAR